MRARGWRGESARHSLAAKGVRTGKRLKYIAPPPLSSATRLPVQVSIIVPSTKDGKRLSTKQFRKRIDEEKEWFSRQFGGDTSDKVVGSFWDGKQLVREKGVIVESSMTIDKYNRMKERIARHAEQRQKQWGQDAVLLEVEGRSFITPGQEQLESAPASHIPVT